MLNVKTPDEVISIINESFYPINNKEIIDISSALGRVLAEDIKSKEYVPGFNRSAVDGYALIAKDTFGCTESIPAILKLTARVEMGENITAPVNRYTCVYVPTGGKIPDGADAVIMIEYTEKFAEDEIAVIKPVSPGENVIYKGDDCKPDQVIAKKGSLIKPQHIACFASLGIKNLNVYKKLKCAVISTGDELVPIEETPKEGQVRDVNSYMLTALMSEWGCEPVPFGFIKDDEKLLKDTIGKAAENCDMVLVSGGSSVGQKDATAKIIESYSPLLFHGIAMKPGKPTILANYNNKPLIGLPGHPAASFFVSNLFVKAIVNRLYDNQETVYTVPAILTESVSANQGRAVYIAVILKKEEGKLYAVPVQSKSGLVSSLAYSDGFIYISRDCEGFAKGSAVEVHMF